MAWTVEKPASCFEILIVFFLRYKCLITSLFNYSVRVGLIVLDQWTCALVSWVYLACLYYNWVMRCEAKPSELKMAAVSAGNFKNISKTVAIQHQMKQTECVFACGGVADECCVDCFPGSLQTLILTKRRHGSEVSRLLSNYGLYWEIF